MGGEEAIYALVGVVLVICLAALIVLIFFLISLQKALTLAGEENRVGLVKFDSDFQLRLDGLHGIKSQ
jgi:hypothetical protein